MLASGHSIQWIPMTTFLLGGFLISGASVAINQLMEKEYDAMMDRTQNRPLPSERISCHEAIWFSVLAGSSGLFILWQTTNMLTMGLAALSLLLYAFVYTPLKRVGPIAVFAGAIPGALPPLIGWTAASEIITHEALIIFGIQFIWQFPHFWAIAWICDEDYKKAGFKLLPGGTKNLNTAINIMIYTLFLLPLGLMPSYFGFTGLTSGTVVTICGILFLAQTFSLMKDTSNIKAKRIMFGSFIYLPIVQITFLIDKV